MFDIHIGAQLFQFRVAYDLSPVYEKIYDTERFIQIIEIFVSLSFSCVWSS